MTMKKSVDGIHPLLMQMSRIERMERGKICRLSGRPHYNHQTWLDGRNVARYVSADQVDDLQEAIDGYHRFMELARQYVDQIIARTRPQPVKTGNATQRWRTRKYSQKKRSRVARQNV